MIVRAGAAGFAVPDLTDLAVLVAVSKRGLCSFACNSPASPSRCGNRSSRFQRL